MALARWFNRHKDVCVCGLLCFVTALASLGFVMWQNAGSFTVCDDFDFQQVPFTIALHKQIERGGLFGWCWNLDLGTSAIQGFGFYELGSPFFWASMLFPADAFPYVVGWMYIIKYVVAGVAAHLFARRFVGRGVSATVVGLLYAFSGFQTTNLMFYHFHDVVALFPFLLIGLERLMGNCRDFAGFVLAFFANALVNYFFFVQSVVFLLIYFAVRFGPALWKEGPRALAFAAMRCLACGLLGCGMAAILLIPSFVYMVQYPGADKSAADVFRPLPDQREFLHFLGGMLLPAVAMNGHNAVYRTRYISAACWLPLVGPSLALAYVKRHRDWLAIMLVLLTVVAFSPVLSAVFVLFKGMYCRWWYAFVLLAALASGKVLDEVLAGERLLAG